MLTDGLDDLEPRSFASGGFADTYRATYKGQPAVAKAFKVTFVNDLENMHKVGGLISEHVVRFTYAASPALRERGRRMEMASAREHSTIRRSYFETAAVFDRLGLDGEREYHEFRQGQSRSEPVPPRGYIVFRIEHR